MRLAGDIDRLPMDVLAAAQREMDHAGGNRAVAHPVNQDEAPQIGVIGIGLERYSPVQGDVAHANRVQGQRFGGLMHDGVDRSEEHTSELQSLMRISYAVFCLKKKNKTQ